MFSVVRLCEDLLNGNLLLVKEGDIGMMGRRLIEPSLLIVFGFLSPQFRMEEEGVYY